MIRGIFWFTGTLLILSIEPMRTELGGFKKEVRLELIMKK